MQNNRTARLILLFAVFLLLLNYPLTAIFDQPGHLFGFPKMYFYLFFIWLLFIILVAWISRTPKS